MTMYISKFRQLSLAAAMGAAVLFGGLFPSGAAFLNPYAHTETLSISGAAEAQYIDQKTDAIFKPAAAPARAASASYEVPQGWSRENLNWNGVSVEKYTAQNPASSRTVFFLHGGGYVGGLHNRYRDWGIHQGDLAGAATLLAVDYRIAPEHTYPAALDDAVAAYKGALAAGYDPGQMVLVGDSAGGNLAAALALYLRDHQIPLPRAIVLISPWVDMGNTLPSRSQNFQKDQILGAKNLRLGGEIARPSYTGTASLTDPYLSPAYADLTGLPPVLITAGGNELFLDDTALLAAHAKAAGALVQYTIYPGMSHDWTILFPELPESAAMNQEIHDFIVHHVK